MRSPNFNQIKRQEAIALSKEQSLDDIVTHVLEKLVPLPEPQSEEAQSLLNTLKPVFYAAIDQVIDKIIDFEAPPLQATNAEVKKTINRFPIERDGIDILNLFLRQKFLSQAGDYFATQSGSVEIITLQKIIDANIRLGASSWDDAMLAIYGGIGTMIDHATLCFRAYHEVAAQDPRDLDEIITTMKRSFSDITNATLLDSLQILALSKILDSGEVPKAYYDQDRDRYRFKVELDQYLLSEEVKERLIHQHLEYNDTGIIPVLLDAKKVSELSKKTDTLGCPVGFRPNKLQKLWEQVVDQAEVIGLL